MKHFEWKMATGLGLAALLALGLPACERSGSGTGGSSASGQSSGKSGSGSSGTSTTGSGSSSDKMGSGSSGTRSGSDTGTGSSASGSSGTGASASGTGSNQQVSGKVQKFDKGSKELTLANSDKKLKLNDKTKVTKNGQKASTSDIHEGDQVRASYSGSGDSVDALVIELVPADATPSPAAK